MSKIPDVPVAMLDHAREQALQALTTRHQNDRVSDYYVIDSNYAGALYLGLPDTDPSAITATDLFAVSTLSIKIPPRAARRLLQAPGRASAVKEALAALPTKKLAEVTDEDFRKMEMFYLAVKSSLVRAEAKAPSDAWVTASKIVARKRPSLFPVRDRDVTTLLGTRSTRDYFTDWSVYQHLMNDSEVSGALKDMTTALAERPDQCRYLFDSEPLRILDVALWTYQKAA